jgi:hypothetical protein
MMCGNDALYSAHGFSLGPRFANHHRLSTLERYELSYRCNTVTVYDPLATHYNGRIRGAVLMRHQYELPRISLFRGGRSQK